MGELIAGFTGSLAGFVYALIRGWSFTLVVLAALPVLFITTGFMTKSQIEGTKHNIMAYGKSGGFAD